jgi:hypothetical protein
LRKVVDIDPQYVFNYRDLVSRGEHFQSEAGAGSRQENASKQKVRALRSDSIGTQKALSALGPPDAIDRAIDIGPCRPIGRKLPPQVGNELGKLVVAKMVLEGRHVAEVGCDRFGDTMQDDLDQIVG